MAPTVEPRALLRRMCQAAVASAQPALCIPPHLPAAPRARLIVARASKASAAMARAVEDHWPGAKSQLGGLVVTRYGYAVPCEQIEIVEAAHPAPDAVGLAAAERLLALVQGLTPDDLVLQVAERGQPVAAPCVLLSGAKPRLPCAARDGEGAAWNACSRWASR